MPSPPSPLHRRSSGESHAGAGPSPSPAFTRAVPTRTAPRSPIRGESGKGSQRAESRSGRDSRARAPRASCLRSFRHGRVPCKFARGHQRLGHGAHDSERGVRRDRAADPDALAAGHKGVGEAGAGGPVPWTGLEAPLARVRAHLRGRLRRGSGWRSREAGKRQASRAVPGKEGSPRPGPRGEGNPSPSSLLSAQARLAQPAATAIFCSAAASLPPPAPSRRGAAFRRQAPLGKPTRHRTLEPTQSEPHAAPRRDRSTAPAARLNAKFPCCARPPLKKKKTQAELTLLLPPLWGFPPALVQRLREERRRRFGLGLGSPRQTFSRYLRAQKVPQRRAKVNHETIIIFLVLRVALVYSPAKGGVGSERDGTAAEAKVETQRRKNRGSSSEKKHTQNTGG